MTSYCEQRATHVLDQHLLFAEDSFLKKGTATLERRAKPRSRQALPVRVWGVDIEDEPFSIDCVLDNISAAGLYLRMPRQMRFRSEISLVVRLPHGPYEGLTAAIKGIVVRDERQSYTRGVAVKIRQHMFL
jgi:PilZ domain